MATKDARSLTIPVNAYTVTLSSIIGLFILIGWIIPGIGPVRNLLSIVPDIVELKSSDAKFEERLQKALTELAAATKNHEDRYQRLTTTTDASHLKLLTLEAKFGENAVAMDDRIRPIEDRLRKLPP